MNNNSLLIIGITGSTGSGKSYLTNNLIKKYSSNLIDKIEVDKIDNWIRVNEGNIRAPTKLDVLCEMALIISLLFLAIWVK